MSARQYSANDLTRELEIGSRAMCMYQGGASLGRPLRHINPSLNIDPNATPSFLKASHRANNSDVFSIRTVPNDDRRSV